MFRLHFPLFVFCVAFYSSAVAQQADLAELNKRIDQLYRVGKYVEATKVAQRALSAAEAKLGPEHAIVGTSLNNLAGLYRAQGRYAEAEPLFKRIVKILEKAFGREHREVGTALNNLAGLYENQGRYVEAEPLYKRTVTNLEEALGFEHPIVGQALNNLAGLYRAQGRYEEAKPLYTRTVTILEKALGAGHPKIGIALNNLARLHQSQGRYEEAEPLIKRSVTVLEKALRPEHPHVGTAVNNLAGQYDIQGRYAEAEPLYRRSLFIREKALGSEHPDVGITLNNLAVLYHVQGRYAEAEPLYKRALVIIEKALGPEHPSVGRSLNSLAELYGKLERAKDQARLRARIGRMPKAGTRHLPIHFATTRRRGKAATDEAFTTTPIFMNEPANAVSFGRVIMQVPAEVIRSRADDLAKNLKLDRGREKLSAADVFKRMRHRHLSRQAFAESLKSRLNRAVLSKDQALIFVHGFNVDFDEAMKRLSQVAFDLEFDGALIVFSWPSKGSKLRYLTDRRRADASVGQFTAFLDQISFDLPNVTLHVMAHSMGNRILTRALHKIALRSQDARRPNLGEIILAHADATTDWCAKLGKARASVRGITNYANRDDAALRLSSTIRAGEDRCGLNPQAYKGIETIDTTGMAGSRKSLVSVMFGAESHHGVFANDPLLFGDISRLIASGQRPAHQRTPEFATRKDKAGGTYWVFDPMLVLGAK